MTTPDTPAMTPDPDRPQPRWTVDDDIRIDGLPILNFTDSEGYAAFVRVRDIWIGPFSHCRRDEALVALVADVTLARQVDELIFGGQRSTNTPGPPPRPTPSPGHETRRRGATMPDRPDPDRPQPHWTVDDDGKLVVNGDEHYFYGLHKDENDALVADVALARRAEAEDWETKARLWDQARGMGVAATPPSGTFCGDDSRIWQLLDFLAGGDDA